MAVSNERRGAEDAGREDQRMVEQAKSKTPITEAVRKAQAENGVVSWDIAIGANCPQDEGPWRGVMYVRSFDCEPEFASWEDKDVGNKYQPATPADAATALRLVAEKLSPDPTRRALEIAARLLCWDKCPNIIELPSPWWDGCKLPRPTGPDALDGVFKPCGSDQQEECWHTYLLEQAAKQLAAETEAAKSEGDDENEE